MVVEVWVVELVVELVVVIVIIVTDTLFVTMQEQAEDIRDGLLEHCET